MCFWLQRPWPSLTFFSIAFPQYRETTRETAKFISFPAPENRSARTKISLLMLSLRVAL